MNIIVIVLVLVVVLDRIPIVLSILVFFEYGDEYEDEIDSHGNRHR
jgi:hypothetical protein